ncbi:MAG: tyrosine-protein phosphatase [Lachnospiraceae bacterium]|nr:tyrosine-protein phosphatase [Lachnospiraceae bacterium]
MKRVITLFLAALLIVLPLAGCTGGTKTVGKDIKIDDITEFYYTVSTSTNPPYYQRYRFFIEDGKYKFFHEKREGDHWPLTEEDATITGTVELTEEQWQTFYSFLEGGTVVARSENNTDGGGRGPWLYLYWKGDKGKVQEFSFKSNAEEGAFEDFCHDLSGALEVIDLPIIHEPEFGGVYIEMTIEDFNALGFEYGDSVKVVFSNGYVLEDIPYYNGYYVNTGQPLLVGYPGYDYIKAAINNGDDLWDEAELKAMKKEDLWVGASLEEHDVASVYLNEKGKYLDIQMARDIHYYDERERYPSDEAFANFRMIKMGDIKDRILYRSASPCDNQHSRAPFVNDLIEAAGVNVILDLADTDAKIEKYIEKEDFNSPYFLTIYEKGNVIPIALNMNYRSDDFKGRIIQGFREMTAKEGPYLVHCTEGKDRTGFVCMLIEALAGADYNLIVDDYMITYDNYYEISEEKDPMRYEVIRDNVLSDMINAMIGDADVDVTTADLSAYAAEYLRSGGMTDAEIEAFLARITE